MATKTSEIYLTNQPEHFICRLVFSFILLDLIMSGFSNTLIHQFQSPVLIFPYIDPTFWIMHLLRIPEFISSNHLIAWSWDFALFGSCLGIIIYPGKKQLVAVFLFLYFIYYIIFNSFGAHHTHSLIPVLMAPVPFLFSKKSFLFCWEGLRYFLLFSYSAAFFWKLLRLSWLFKEQGVLIMKENLTPYLYFNPHSFLSEIYFYFLDHPGLTQFFLLSGFVFEGIFIIGFFTKKYDKYLLILSLILPFGFWFFADAVFIEQIILSLTLIPIAFYSGMENSFKIQTGIINKKPLSH